MLIKQKIILAAVLVISIAIVSDIYKIYSSSQLEKIFNDVVEHETPSLTSLIEIKSSARQASLKAIEYSIRGEDKDINKTREAIEKIRLHLSTYKRIKTTGDDSQAERINALNIRVEDFIQITEKYLLISEGPSLSQLTIDESELHKARKNLINVIGSVKDTNTKLLLEKIKSEARKASIKSIEYYLRGRQKDHDKAVQSIDRLNKLQAKMVELVGRSSITDIVLSISAYSDAASKYLKDISQRKSPVTKIYFHEEELNKSRKNLIHLLYDLIKVEKDELHAANILAKESINSLISVTTTASILLIMTIIALNVLVYRAIATPILNLIGVTKKIGSGNLDAQINVTSNDEIKELADAFNTMVNQLKYSRADREQALSNLQEREQDLAITLNSIGDAVIATDAKGNVTRMNPVAETLTGWSLDESIGLPLKIIFPIVNASTREPIDNPVERVLSTGEIVYLSNHTTLIAKDGTEYQIADSAAPINNDKNDILGMVLVFNDVTEQYNLRELAAKSKRNMQAIMDNSPSAIYAKDTDGRYIFINQECEKLFGKKQDEIIGKTDYDIFDSKLADRFSRDDNIVLKKGSALKLEETALLDDKSRTYMSTKFPLQDKNSDIYAICGISTDITEYKNQEEQLRRSQKMDALGKLTGGVAHDYNNMLGIILGYSDLLTNMLNDQPELKKYASEILHAGERGAQLTKKLLSFASKKTTNGSQLSINTLLRDMENILEKTLTARITLTLDLVNDVWPVHLDSGELEDAVVNMNINAMHAIQGNGHITIQTRNESLSQNEAALLSLNKGDYVILSVTDTGSGMDNETVEKVFEPFYSTKGEGGTGLGLSQVYGFVERSGGVIKVYTEQGKGTQFALYFPRYFDSTEDASDLEDEESIDLNGSDKILVVDDEQALINYTSTVLSSHGYQVYSASSAKAALKILETEAIDVMLTDVIMPEMDGYELATIVQKKYPDIKIQMASGFSDNRHEAIQDSELHKNLLHKPYKSKALLLRIRELLK